jgi:hypothetical protein
MRYVPKGSQIMALAYILRYLHPRVHQKGVLAKPPILVDSFPIGQFHWCLITTLLTPTAHQNISFVMELDLCSHLSHV